MSGIVDRFNRPISSEPVELPTFAGQGFKLPPPGQCPMVDPTATPAVLEPEAEAQALARVVTDVGGLINLAHMLSRLTYALAHEVLALRSRVAKLEATLDPCDTEETQQSGS